MAAVYRYFNPALVEVLANAKFGSMSKFLTAAKRDASWWHRSKKKPTVKVYDIEKLAELLGCHPADLFNESAETNEVEEPKMLYLASNSAVNERIAQVITLKANGSQVRFSELTGLGESQVSNITTKKHAPGFSTLSKIITTFPNLNARWLITGQGGPITSEQDDHNLRALLESKDEIIKLLRSQIEVSTKKNS